MSQQYLTNTEFFLSKWVSSVDIQHTWCFSSILQHPHFSSIFEEGIDSSGRVFYDNDVLYITVRI